ncbi:hypothetical protein HMPREF1544_06642 [Mucor circinelloides 1006PhL]|uniref:Uncharacterized protein n=1 Tax=Mucor circinelloides f. circinelloides (strain 1006PhL) TaxID=1220926 RepID=S2JUU8_MUCC1|nr:hypothetical protein HMPREF1544_06642 [Mucor circinelloides 1006PhL]
MFDGSQEELADYISSNVKQASFTRFLEKYKNQFKVFWHEGQTISVKKFANLWKTRYNSASGKNYQLTSPVRQLTNEIYTSLNPEQVNHRESNTGRYFLRNIHAVSYVDDDTSRLRSHRNQIVESRKSPAQPYCFIENINISVICREFQTKAMIKENEEVELELGEALSLKDIYLIKPVVMDENCASSNSFLNIIPKKTVAVEVGQSRFIDNVVQRAFLHSSRIARLDVIQELHSNPNKVCANVLLLPLFKYHAVGQDMIKHGQFFYLSGSKKYKPDIRYSSNEFDSLVWEVRTPRSNLDDTEDLAMQLEHMLQRIISAGLGDATVFGVVVVKGFVGHVYKMIMPAVNIYLRLEIDFFQLPNSISQFSTCVETVAVLQNLHKKIRDQSRLLREIL